MDSVKLGKWTTIVALSGLSGTLLLISTCARIPSDQTAARECLERTVRLPSAVVCRQAPEEATELYILAGRLDNEGRVVPDSTGLIGYAPTSTVPAVCPACSARIMDTRGAYVAGALHDLAGRSIHDLDSVRAHLLQHGLFPPVYFCGYCGKEFGAFRCGIGCLYDSLKAVHGRVLGSLALRATNPFDPVVKESLHVQARVVLGESRQFCVKADSMAFWGRVLQVFNVAPCDLTRPGCLLLAVAPSDDEEVGSEKVLDVGIMLPEPGLRVRDGSPVAWVKSDRIGADHTVAQTGEIVLLDDWPPPIYSSHDATVVRPSVSQHVHTDSTGLVAPSAKGLLDSLSIGPLLERSTGRYFSRMPPAVLPETPDEPHFCTAPPGTHALPGGDSSEAEVVLRPDSLWQDLGQALDTTVAGDTLFVCGDMKTYYWRIVRVMDAAARLGFHAVCILYPVQ